MTDDPAASLDIEQPGVLDGWLRQHGHLAPTEKPQYAVLAGGVSNRTVLVSRAEGPSWVVKQALAKLRVAVDWFSSPARIHREADGLRWLIQFAPDGTITPLVFEDTADHIVGMLAVPQPHENWKTQLLRGEVDPDAIRQFAEIGAAIHARSTLRLAELRGPFGDRGFFESLRVEPYYRYTASQVPESAGFYAALIAEMVTRLETLVHGDFSPKNVLVHDGRLILLDHEVIHIGDPGFDLGFALTHLLSKAHHMPEQRSQFLAAAEQFWTTYQAQANAIAPGRWLDGLEARAVRHTLGCLLARVRGRSPLEYLNQTERERQARIVCALMANPPATIGRLAATFGDGIEQDEQHG
ncbi:MAG TPA: aminoglycoside phosphotransferase family protein [Thermomicrobiales bacterium]|nr:aminoglycoside phosphotransferase family protein [Thermomicrobiales bacterium]